MSDTHMPPVSSRPQVFPVYFVNRFLLILDTLYDMLKKDYTNLVMASLIIPDGHRGNPRSDEITAINGVKCGQSDYKENEAIPQQEAVKASLPQDRSDKLLQQCKLSRHYTLSAPIEEYSIFYIGCESRTLSNLIISYHSCQVWEPRVHRQNPETFCLAVLLLQSCD